VESVHIEFQRVQTWLFAVPRLRAMVGANVLIGEMLRVHLPELARETSRWQLYATEGRYPAAIAEDPLAEYDDPAADAKQGIISRDGGHFEAIFQSGAYEFAQEADTLLQRMLPGLRYSISIDNQKIPVATVGLSTELPVLAPCQWTGRGIASGYAKRGDREKSHMVSLDVLRRHNAAKRAENRQARDIVSMLMARIAPDIARPNDFDELVRPGYLAVIHADGNAVGQSVANKDAIDRAIRFHQNRVLMRHAVSRAIAQQYEGTTTMRLIPLMLGGDDLLIVSRADIALPFVTQLCEELNNIQTELTDDSSSFLLTLGVGVVFASPKVPIHRLHSVAEQLASSAKRRFRGLSPSEPCSVVDWAVYTTSWVDDPEDVRRRDWVGGGGERILSRRPMNVLGHGLDSLQGLLAKSEKIREGPRSQFRYLVEQLSRGQALSELAFEELSPQARDAMKEAGIDRVWQDAGGGKLITSVLDLIEVTEINRLGRAGREQKENGTGERTHAEA
jgi:hypothetical protein